MHRFAGGNQCLRVTVYEKSSYVGGRATTINAHDSPQYPIELGASIFVKVNHILVSAAERFGLSTESFDFHDEKDEEKSDLGVWDGSEWVFYQDDASPAWWNIAKLLWKYGTAPLRTHSLMKSTVGQFLKMYSAPYFPFRDLSETAYELGLTDVTALTGEQFLRKNKISEAFSQDLIQASTRVNYAQNLNRIHGLETMVCMAIEGAMSISGGNWQIFDRMLKASGATVKLNSTVTRLEFENGRFSLKASSVSNEGPSVELSAEHDTVILAAPSQFAELFIHPRLGDPPPEIPYVKLHVTLFTSPFSLKPESFNLAPSDTVPSTVLTTANRIESKQAPFLSISKLRTVINPKAGGREYVYKIFSPEALTNEYIPTLLKTSEDTAERDDDPITWIYRKIWNSYPVELPRVTFESPVIHLYDPDEEEEEDDKEDGGKEATERRKRKLWYTSAIEPFISTMETSSLMGMNVARMIVDEWFEEEEESGQQEEGGNETAASGGARDSATGQEKQDL